MDWCSKPALKLLYSMHRLVHIHPSLCNSLQHQGHLGIRLRGVKDRTTILLKRNLQCIFPVHVVSGCPPVPQLHSFWFFCSIYSLEMSRPHRPCHCWPIAVHMQTYYTVNVCLKDGDCTQAIWRRKSVSVLAEPTPNQSVPRPGFMRVHLKKIPVSRWNLTPSIHWEERTSPLLSLPTWIEQIFTGTTKFRNHRAKQGLDSFLLCSLSQPPFWNQPL